MAANHYEALGVPKDADPTAIKQAYRKLARQLHPDVNPSPEAAEKFKAVTHAFSVLSDPKKRTLHDADIRQAGSRQQPAAKPEPGKPSAGPSKPQGAPTAPKGKETVKYYGAKDDGPKKPAAPAGGPSKPAASRPSKPQGRLAGGTPPPPSNPDAPQAPAAPAGRPSKPKLGGTKLGAMHTQMFAPRGQGSFVKSNLQFRGRNAETGEKAGVFNKDTNERVNRGNVRDAKFSTDSAFDRFNRNRPDIYAEYKANADRHETPYKTFSQVQRDAERLRAQREGRKADESRREGVQLSGLNKDRKARRKSGLRAENTAATQEAQRSQESRGTRFLATERSDRFGASRAATGPQGRAEAMRNQVNRGSRLLNNERNVRTNAARRNPRAK